MKKKETATRAKLERAAFTDSDKRRFIDVLRLWKPGLPKLKTPEDFIAQGGWYEATLDGAVFGNAWSDHEVQYLGWALDWMSDPPPVGWYILDPNAANIRTPEPPEKPAMLCGVRVHHSQSRAFAEILFRGYQTGFESMDSIQNTQFCNNAAEVIRVWRGFELFKHIQKHRGRKPRAYTDRPQFEKDAIGTHLRLIRKHENSRYEDRYEYSQEKIAEEMGFKSINGWRKRANALGVDLDELKRQAIRAATEIFV